MGLLAAGAVTMIAGTSMGAALSDIVIKGPRPARIHENAEISVFVAERLAKHCIEEAASKNMSVSVAVLDQYGTLTYYYRADGQPKGAAESALAKAKTAWTTRNPTHALQNQVALNPWTAAQQFQQGNFPVAGGLPIVVDNQFLGAIRVGGMAATPPTWSDEIGGWNALHAIIGHRPDLVPVRRHRAPRAA